METKPQGGYCIIALEELVCNVSSRQVHGRHGRAGSKLLFLLGILMCFHIVILVCSYRGYYCGLSIHLRGFDSPTDRQLFIDAVSDIDTLGVTVV